MDISVVVLDLDGTIVRLPIEYKDMRDALSTYFLKFRIRSDFKPLYETITDSCKTISDAYSEKDARNAHINALKIIEEFEIAGAYKSIQIDGSIEFVRWAKNKGLKISIFSSNSRRCVEKTLEKFNITKYIDMIVSSNDVSRLKPSDEGLKIISEKMNIGSDRMLMIGDSVNDIVAAKSFGVHAFAVLSGDCNKEELEKSGAEKICKTLYECMEMI